MTTIGDEREDEASDLFSVKPYNSGTSIPKIERVPLTKEEIRRRKIIRAAWISAAMVTALALVWLTIYLLHRSAIREAALLASDTGRVAAIRAALETLEGERGADDRALALRLRAMAVLAGEAEDEDAIRDGLRGLADDPDAAPHHAVAATYLALAAGDLAATRELVTAVTARGDHAAEAAHARALVARALGNVEQALAASQLAVELRPEAPRHVALHAELLAQSGDLEAAIARLDELPAGADGPGVLVARARIRDGAGAALSEVAEHARAALDAPDASAHERAWARLLLARAAAAAGDRARAREHLDHSVQVAPPGDELFTLALVEAALRIGADALALEAAEGLPSPLSVDAGRRAQLDAELALARHDLAAAEAALERAPAGPRTLLARARLLLARGRAAEARPLFGEAAAGAGLRVPATVHLARLELLAGRAAEASALVEPLLADHPDHPDVVPIAVEAALGLDASERAEALVTPALERHPRDARLLAARARVSMARSQWADALERLDQAIALEADDASLHADRGRVGVELGRADLSREAFDAALALSAAHPDALLGRLALDVEERRVAEARAIFERVGEAERARLDVARLEARLLVMEVAGRSGLASVREAVRAHGGDSVLTLALGWLELQAEQYSAAVRTFGRFASGEGMIVEALLGRSLAQIRMRLSAPAAAALESFREGGDVDALGASDRALLSAIDARLALGDNRKASAERAATQAIELEPHEAEAHLVLADLALGRDEDPSASLRAALVGPRPSSRPLAVLPIRAEAPDDDLCELAHRYRRAAPGGQYSRGVARVLRDCRR